MPISEYKQEIDNLTINYKNIDTIVYEMPKEQENKYEKNNYISNINFIIMWV